MLAVVNIHDGKKKKVKGEKSKVKWAKGILTEANAMCLLFIG